MAKFAHFEDVKPDELSDLYVRHAEIARAMHEWGIKEFTGIEGFQVDLVPMIPLVPREETLREMSKYDVVSVSSVFDPEAENIMPQAIFDEIVNFQTRGEDGMPAIIAAVGNQGGNAEYFQDLHLTDFVRNGLLVGEANEDGDGLYVEDHSSRDPDLIAFNPLDEMTMPVINLSPDLTGHEDLIRKELYKIVEAGIVGAAIDDEDVKSKLYEDKEALDQIVKDIIANPAIIQEYMLSLLREKYDFDENGYASGVDGTSLSAPYVAGHISGAILLEEDRAEEGLPILTTEEIMTLAKLATEQVSLREGPGINNNLEEIPVRQNNAGHDFTHYGGHGVFMPDKFRALLDEAHAIIETNPDIDRSNLSYILPGKSLTPLSVSFKIPDDERQNLIFEKMSLTFDTREAHRIPAITLDRGFDDKRLFGVSNRVTENVNYSWLAADDFFGERIEPGSTWEVRPFSTQGRAGVENANLKLHAYREDSLMGQMIARHRDAPARENIPEIQEDWERAALPESAKTPTPAPPEGAGNSFKLSDVPGNPGR